MSAPRPELPSFRGEATALIEADVLEGVRAVPLSFYGNFRMRICRPVNLTAKDREQLVQYAIQRLGHQYDLKNVFDLARYLLRFPMPARLRRRMIGCGSGDPTRAICSTLIAQAFGAVRYPILPIITRKRDGNPGRADRCASLWRIRHYSLYAPATSTSPRFSRWSNPASWDCSITGASPGARAIRWSSMTARP